MTSIIPRSGDSPSDAFEYHTHDPLYERAFNLLSFVVSSIPFRYLKFSDFMKLFLFRDIVYKRKKRFTHGQ